MAVVRLRCEHQTVGGCFFALLMKSRSQRWVSALGSGLQNSILAKQGRSLSLGSPSAKTEFCKPDPLSYQRAIMNSNTTCPFPAWC